MAITDPECSSACIKVLRTCTHKIELRRLEFCQDPSLFLAMRSVLTRDSSCIACDTIVNSEIETVLKTIPSTEIPDNVESALSNLQNTPGADSAVKQCVSWFRAMMCRDRDTVGALLFLLGVHKGKPEHGIPRPIPDWYKGQGGGDPLGRLAELAVGCKVDDPELLKQFRMLCQTFVSEYLTEYYTKGFPW